MCANTHSPLRGRGLAFHRQTVSRPDFRLAGRRRIGFHRGGVQEFPGRWIALVQRRAVEYEVHAVAVDHAHVGEANVGVVSQQDPERLGRALVSGRAVLVGTGELLEIGPVHQCGGTGRGASQIGAQVLQQDLAHDHIDYADARHGGAPGDQATEDGREPWARGAPHRFERSQSPRDFCAAYFSSRWYHSLTDGQSSSPVLPAAIRGM